MPIKGIDNTLEIKLHWKGIEYVTLINIDTKNYSKFVDDCLNSFDAALRQVIAFNKFDINYKEATEDQIVEIDTIIESLK